MIVPGNWNFQFPWGRTCPPERFFFSDHLSGETRVQQWWVRDRWDHTSTKLLSCVCHSGASLKPRLQRSTPKMDLGLGLLNLFVPFPSVTVLTRSLYFLLLAISEALLIVLLGTGGWIWLARTTEQGPGSNNSGDTNTISKICRLFILKPFDLQKNLQRLSIYSS